MPDDQLASQLRTRVAEYEDAGHGSCVLGRPEAAEIVANALRRGHPSSFELYAWVVMPNHVHVLIQQTAEIPLNQLVRAWKGVSSHAINELFGTKGRLWSREYFDRYIRNDEHFERARAYIEENPVKAQFCTSPCQWRFSSAWRGKSG